MYSTYEQHQDTAWGNRVTGWRCKLATVALGVLVASSAVAGDLERSQAKRIHDRLTGVPPTPAFLTTMENEIINNGAVSAALLALDRNSNPRAFNFYNTTLKNFATPWTNEAQSVFDPLNDYSATVIGMIRDDVPFNTLLSADLIYVGDSNISGVAAYSPANNTHYLNLENLSIDLSDPTNLFSASQSAQSGIPAAGVAGVITTRAAAQAFFIDGTNRAMFRFTMLNHLCNDMEQLKDTTRPADRIRQDVSRSPGGDSRIFMNACIGCHTGMDPMTQAFAYHNYDAALGRLVYTPGQVQPKYLINAGNFEYGYVTPDDSWDNYWRSGPNAVMGWSAGLTGSGNGAASLGQELGNSTAFASCQVRKAYRTVCLNEPSQTQMTALMGVLTGQNYNMKQVFAEASVQCMGS
ncbi:FIG01036274: hypothetical protein [hydrothermal vent metagenome]|uniref:DUF1585 domain-containing protein n=1 Tax=hydrothermal vent metagenome TaxID=652676 RepID=A0A3B0YNZ6_9ZZZZ